MIGRTHMPRRARVAATLAALVAIAASSCTENLPSGPLTFPGGTLQIAVPHDTLVVGDTSIATARAVDNAGNLIQALSFNWSTSDPSVLAFGAANSEDATAGRVKSFVGVRPGRSVVSLALPDPRFVISAVARNVTVVVGGVRILSSHDTTLTAINDTGRAIAAGLVRSGGALVPKVSQGIRWTHLGTRTTVVGTGDTIRYIARSNGADTLIATHDFCLAGAKCADTAIVRVSQQLTLTLSSRNFTSWSFGDTLGPVATLADRRGNGLAGTSIRFVPVTAFDAAIVTPTPPIGISNFATGVMATPKLVSIGNGTAQVVVQAVAADGSVITSDVITETVRQVAVRVSVEPLRAVMSILDSIPIRSVARDARGFPIADATIALVETGVTLHGIWAGPSGTGTIGQGTITPDLTGIATPGSNPSAPQIPVAVNPSMIRLVAVDTIKADVAQLQYGMTVLDSVGNPATGSWIRFRASSGASPDSVQVGPDGFATVTWPTRTLAGYYTLTGVRSARSLATLGDSAGRVVLRRSVQVVAAAPDPASSTLSITATSMVNTTGTATLTVNVFDVFGNPVLNVVPGDLSVVATRGTISGASCASGVCTFTYTAPATAGADAITVKIGTVQVQGSPIALTIT